MAFVLTRPMPILELKKKNDTKFGCLFILLIKLIFINLLIITSKIKIIQDNKSPKYT